MNLGQFFVLPCYFQIIYIDGECEVGVPSLMIVAKNGDLKVGFVEASDDQWAPKASDVINRYITVLMKACIICLTRSCNSLLSDAAIQLPCSSSGTHNIHLELVPLKNVETTIKW